MSKFRFRFRFRYIKSKGNSVFHKRTMMKMKYMFMRIWTIRMGLFACYTTVKVTLGHNQRRVM